MLVSVLVGVNDVVEFTCNLMQQRSAAHCNGWWFKNYPERDWKGAKGSWGDGEWICTHSRSSGI